MPLAVALQVDSDEAQTAALPLAVSGCHSPSAIPESESGDSARGAVLTGSTQTPTPSRSSQANHDSFFKNVSLTGIFSKKSLLIMFEEGDDSRFQLELR